MSLATQIGRETDSIMDQFREEVFNRNLSRDQREENFVKLAQKIGRLPCLSQDMILREVRQLTSKDKGWDQGVLEVLKVVLDQTHLDPINTYRCTELSKRLIKRINASEHPFYKATRLFYEFKNGWIYSDPLIRYLPQSPAMKKALRELKNLSKKGNARAQYCYAKCLVSLKGFEFMRIGRVLASQSCKQNYPPALLFSASLIDGEEASYKVMTPLRDALRLGCSRSLSELAIRGAGYEFINPYDRMHLLNIALSYNPRCSELYWAMEKLIKGPSRIYAYPQSLNYGDLGRARFLEVADVFLSLADIIGSSEYRNSFQMASHCIEKKNKSIALWGKYSVNQNLAGYEICLDILKKLNFREVRVDKDIDNRPICIESINRSMLKVLLKLQTWILKHGEKERPIHPSFYEIEQESVFDSMFYLIRKAQLFYLNQYNLIYDKALALEREGSLEEAAEVFIKSAQLGCKKSLFRLSYLLLDPELNLSSNILNGFLSRSQVVHLAIESSSKKDTQLGSTLTRLAYFLLDPASELSDDFLKGLLRGGLELSDAKAQALHLAIQYSDKQHPQLENALGLEIIKGNIHPSIWISYCNSQQLSFLPAVAYLFHQSYLGGVSEGLANLMRLTANPIGGRLEEIISSYDVSGRKDVLYGYHCLSDKALRECDHTASLLTCCAIATALVELDSSGVFDKYDAWKQYHSESRVLAAVAMLRKAISLGSTDAYFILAVMCEQRKEEHHDWWKDTSALNIYLAGYEYLRQGAQEENALCIALLESPWTNKQMKSYCIKDTLEARKFQVLVL